MAVVVEGCSLRMLSPVWRIDGAICSVIDTFLNASLYPGLNALENLCVML